MGSEGWGGGRWGATFWGGGPSEDLRLLSALAVAENVVRLTFNSTPFIDGLLTPNDASNRRRYAVTADVTTTGLDGFTARPVLVLEAIQVVAAGTLGSEIDVYVDRPFSPYPARYVVAVNNLVASGTGLPLDSDASSLPFFGVLRDPVPNTRDQAAPSRDLASPQTAASLMGSGVLPSFGLGGFGADAGGDYAVEQGQQALRKRVFRRFLTRKGAFAHLPTYGVGVMDSRKKLNTASARQAIAADAENQLRQEPDVRAVSVQAIARAPGLVVFATRIQTASGASVSVDVPVVIGS